MDTAPLKSFAMWARTALIAEVSARLAVVLAPGSTVRVEQPNAVTELERAIGAAGRGDTGRAAVAEKVAYTWFNRIIALRFMDANGFTGGVGVVSPERGKTTGQPEVLTDAKRGAFDTEVVRPATVQAVTNLLDGTRRSADPQGEAYALLLAEYCRYWHKAMPFMFEREGDYTEALIPSNLLADDSVMSHSVEVLTEELCADVEVIGWLYQFYIAERKDEVFAGFKKNKKAGAAEIPAATQLFTPHWIVRYLVENSLGRLWLLNRPSSRLADQMDYYIAPVEEETEFLRVEDPEALTVIDPACGSGHMLTCAFDLLYAIYEEEGYAPSDIAGLILSKNLFGVEIDPRAGALAAFALTMKARGRQRTFFGKGVEPNICVLEPISFTNEGLDLLLTPGGDGEVEKVFWNLFESADTFGSLIQPDPSLVNRLARHVNALDARGDMLHAQTINKAGRILRQAECLAARYCVVVANPPYMGTKSMGSRLSEFATANYPESKSDLFAMFIERNLNLAVSGGVIAMITMQSWMFIKSFMKLRQTIMAEYWIQSMVHLGTGAFESISGEVVSTTAWSMVTRYPRGHSTFISALGPRGRGKGSVVRAAAAGEVSADVHVIHQKALAGLPGSPMAYWLSDRVIEAFVNQPSVASLFEIKVGMQTSNNAKYLRYWWEVSASGIYSGGMELPEWIWYAKGGPFRRWTGNLDSVLHYRRDPEYILEQENATVLPLSALRYAKVTWTHMSPGRVSFRLLPAATFHDIGSHAIYVDDARSYELLGYLNTMFVGGLIQALNPTVNIQTSDVARIPMFDLDAKALEGFAAEAVEVSRADEMTQETTFAFDFMPLVNEGSLGVQLERHRSTWIERGSRLRAIESEVETLVADSTRVNSVSDPAAVTLANDGALDASAWTRSRANELASYAVGCMFGRYSLDEAGLILANQGASLAEYLAKVPSPSFTPDADNVIPIVDGDWFEDDILARFRAFLRVAFGEEHFEENLRFATESLGVKDLRAYFLKSFYADHVKRYKRRPIYWMFSSPKGSFNALIYLHRYTPSTVSVVLNEYLREYVGKMEASRQHHERLAAAADMPRARAAAQKEVDRLRKVLLELEEYEHDVLYPLATQQIAIDIDDGVKVNYPKFGTALKKIPGLEARE